MYIFVVSKAFSHHQLERERYITNFIRDIFGRLFSGIHKVHFLSFVVLKDDTFKCLLGNSGFFVLREI